MKTKKDSLVGVNLTIFQDPFTREKEEGRATVKSVVERGAEGKVGWAECWVRFDNEKDDYLRIIAHI